MKVGELRERLSKMNKQELIKLTVEFYKLIPKAKKEDYQLDQLIQNPDQKKKGPKKGQLQSIGELEQDITTFISHAKEQYYLAPNRVVPKKERPKWRFKVKRWYKELTNSKRPSEELPRQADILKRLYELICESCGFQYFTAYDSFESIGIEQTEFYQSVIYLIQKAEGKASMVEPGIRLIVDNYLNRYTLFSGLMEILIAQLHIPDLKEKGIAISKKIIAELQFTPKPESNRFQWSSSGEFRKKEKHNNLVELIFRLHMSLYEYEEAIAFFHLKYSEARLEIKLYILVSMLFGYELKDHIKQEIEIAQKSGIVPRQSLLNLLKTINETDQLPEYLR